jgi:uncharacterized protein YcfL
MRKLFIYLSIPCLFLLAGCTTSTPEPTHKPEPTALPTEAPALVPTAEPTKVVDFCVDCHTDKEQLISTAKPVVEAESESSGVG